MRTERKKKPLEERVSASYRLAIAYCLIFYWLHLIGLEVWVTFLDQPIKQNQCNLSCVGCTLENHSLRKFADLPQGLWLEQTLQGLPPF